MDSSVIATRTVHAGRLHNISADLYWCYPNRLPGRAHVPSPRSQSSLERSEPFGTKNQLG